MEPKDFSTKGLLGTLFLITHAFGQSESPKLVITPVIKGSPLQIQKHDLDWPAGTSLNLSCQWDSLTESNFRSDDYEFKWTTPEEAAVLRQNANSCQSCLEIKDPKKSDSGSYNCTAVNPKLGTSDSFQADIILHVRPFFEKPASCGPSFFQCQGLGRQCIPQRYVCDGRVDCPDGADESKETCGFGDPCDSKLPCLDGRCMDPSLCCDPLIHLNCTVIRDCCRPLIESNRHHYRLGIGSQHEIRFLHSTIYIIVGCILAFLIILLVVTVVICRYYAKRRGGVWRFGRGGGGGGPLTRADLDLYFAYLQRLDSLGGRITYNVNNGVQVVAAAAPNPPPPPYNLVAGEEGGRRNPQNAPPPAGQGGNPPPYDVARGRGGANEAGDHGAGQPLMEENNNEENEGNNNGDINGNSDMVDHNEVRRRQLEGDRERR